MFIESPTEFTVDAKSVSPVGKGNLRATVKNPSGTETPTAVQNNGDGTYNVAYTPFEQGKKCRILLVTGVTLCRWHLWPKHESAPLSL